MLPAHTRRLKIEWSHFMTIKRVQLFCSLFNIFSFQKERKKNEERCEKPRLFSMEIAFCCIRKGYHRHWNYHFLHFLRNWYLKLLTGVYYFGIFGLFFGEIYLDDNDTDKELFRAFINLGLSWFQFLCFYVKHAALPGINFHVKVQVKNISVNLKCPFYWLTLRDYASWRIQHLQHDS